MQLELKSFADAGVLDKERLIIRVLADVNIGSYVVLRSKKNDNGMPISGTKDAYWFPDVKVSRGDLIVLYTKRGTSSKKVQKAAAAWPISTTGARVLHSGAPIAATRRY